MKAAVVLSLIMLGGFAQAAPISIVEIYQCSDITDKSFGDMTLVANVMIGTGAFIDGTLAFNDGSTRSLELNSENARFSEEEEGEYSLRIKLPEYRGRAIYCEKTGSQG